MAPSSDSADNVISRASQLADSHLYVVRNISTGLAIAGVILCARSIKLLTKFTNVKDIPDKFIQKNLKLRGKIVCVTEHAIEVDHIPITLPILASFQKRWHGHGTLLVRLAGVELSQSGKVWLQNHLQPSQMLWFQLLNREESVLDCFIFVKKRWFFNECLNVLLVREGLGRTASTPSIQQDPRHNWPFYKQLLQAEVRAQKAGKGVWKPDSQLNLTNKILHNGILQHMKHLIRSLVTCWKKIKS
ncbi:protein C3orf33 homolog [Pseudophryne corroboree]|uniref:protein C3orf33 homolog n=1 Tax=Pseudophryne corroboree TaxID=495146 RepID=UPI003081836D